MGQIVVKILLQAALGLQWGILQTVCVLGKENVPSAP